MQNSFDKFMENGGNCLFILLIFLFTGFLIFMSDRGFQKEANQDYNEFQTLTIPIIGATIDSYNEVFTVTVLDNRNAFKPKREKYVRSFLPEGLNNYKNQKITRFFFAETVSEQRLVINKGENPLEMYFDVYLTKDNPPAYY